MEWEFTSQQVVRAEVDYGLDDFRRDLFREVQMNAGTAGHFQARVAFDLLFDLCNWLARGWDFDAFVALHAHAPPTCEFLRGVREAMAPNADMLGAILQRMIMVEIEQGATTGEAVSRVHGVLARHAAMPP